MITESQWHMVLDVLGLDHETTPGMACLKIKELMEFEPSRVAQRQAEWDAAVAYYELLESCADAKAVEAAKDKLDAIMAPFADNQAFAALLFRERAARSLTI